MTEVCYPTPGSSYKWEYKLYIWGPSVHKNCIAVAQVLAVHHTVSQCDRVCDATPQPTHRLLLEVRTMLNIYDKCMKNR